MEETGGDGSKGEEDVTVRRSPEASVMIIWTAMCMFYKRKKGKAGSLHPIFNPQFPFSSPETTSIYLTLLQDIIALRTP